MADELERVPDQNPLEVRPPLARGAHREAVTALGLYSTTMRRARSTPDLMRPRG